MPLGVHTSIGGGLHKSVERAVELGCDAFQIFSRNPRSWAYEPVDAGEAALFRGAREKSGISAVAVHATYLINLSSPDDVIFSKSVDLFKKELGIAESLGADYMVTHLGSFSGGTPELARARVAQALRDIAAAGHGKNTMILFENSAGAGSSYGSTLAEIGWIIKDAQSRGIRAGLCFDTCHAFAAGYPMRTRDEVKSLVKAIADDAGPGSLRLIHLNDSKGALGSRIDRHEHIGKGRIGKEGMREILSRKEFLAVPMILETPKKEDKDDARNLAAVRAIIAAAPKS